MKKLTIAVLLILVVGIFFCFFWWRNAVVIPDKIYLDKKIYKGVGDVKETDDYIVIDFVLR